MPSCSSSSNIKATIISPTITVNASGNRILFVLKSSDAGYTIGSGITGGHVIRYDPQTYSYEKSSAKAADTAEVIGVVENISVSSGITSYNVIASGLMTYPDINLIPDLFSPTGDCESITSLGGGAGGKDIFFLSDGCTGNLQCLEPNTPGSIVKPIIQRINLPGSNAIVLNYIGYEVGQEAEAQFPIDGLVGSVIDVPTQTIVPNGYLDISTQQLVNVADYPELYEIFEYRFGVYVERVFITTTPNTAWVPLLANAIQAGINTGKIVGVNISQKYIDIERSNTENLTDNGVPIQITASGLATTSVLPLSAALIKFTIPSTTPIERFFNSTPAASGVITLKPLMKVKNNLSFVSIPDGLKLAGLSLGTLNNVEQTLINLCDDSSNPGLCV